MNLHSAMMQLLTERSQYAALEAVDEELKKTIKGGLLGAKQLSE